MKKYFFLLCIVLSFGKVHAQDLLITGEGDTLNCKISKIEKGNIYFTFRYKGEIRNTLLPSYQVKKYQYNYFPKAEVPAEKVIVKQPYQHFRLAVNAGWSYRMATLSGNIPSQFMQYVEKLKSGYHFGIDAGYFVSEPIALGAKFNLFHTSNQMDNISVTQQNGTQLNGMMKDDITITFLGPSLYTRLMSNNKKGAFVSGLSIGYLSYTDNATVIYDFSIKGNTIGFVADIGYDFSLSPSLILGLLFSYSSGSISSVEISDGVSSTTIQLPNGQKESLSRIDLSVGLRFQ